jgi:hypothetical protein
MVLQGTIGEEINILTNTQTTPKKHQYIKKNETTYTNTNSYKKTFYLFFILQISTQFYLTHDNGQQKIMCAQSC